MKNAKLAAARQARDDEFFTLTRDVEAEISAYLTEDPQLFRGKTVFLPCDDPESSAFAVFFRENFVDFGLKTLICTSFAENKVPSKTSEQPILDGLDGRVLDGLGSEERGKCLVLNASSLGGRPLREPATAWQALRGSGDFRSAEVSDLRNRADFIFTNPPFSLFSQFFSWVTEANVGFSVVGPLSAATSPQVFPFLQRLEVWLGQGFSGGNAYFSREKTRGIGNTQSESPAGLVKMRNIVWFTNLDHRGRHKPLVSREPNLNDGSRRRPYLAEDFPTFDQIEAIEVSQVSQIPEGYTGLMGVPVSFLQSFSPEEFELVGLDRLMNENPRPGHRFTVGGKETFARVFIRRWR